MNLTCRDIDWGDAFSGVKFRVVGVNFLLFTTGAELFYLNLQF